MDKKEAVSKFLKLGKVSIARKTNSTKHASEKKTEQAFLKYAKTKNVLALKLVDKGRSGFPDRTIILPSGKIFFIEFKHGSNKMSVNQVIYKDKLIKYKLSYYTCYSLESAIQALTMEAYNDQ